MRRVGRFTVERRLYRYETTDHPANGNIPAHKSKRSVDAGIERVTVDVDMDEAKIITSVCSNAAHTKGGKAVLLGGLVRGRVVKREPVAELERGDG